MIRHYNGAVAAACLSSLICVIHEWFSSWEHFEMSLASSTEILRKTHEAALHSAIQQASFLVNENTPQNVVIRIVR